MKIKTTNTRALPIRDPEVFPVHHMRRYIVTGAARGLGYAIAQALVARGARIAMVDILEAELDAAVESLGGSSANVFGIHADLLRAGAATKIIESSIELLGDVDGLVNGAGIVRHSDPLEIPAGDWEVQLRLHVQAPYELSRAVARRLIDEGRPGAIVNVASEAGKSGHAHSLAYSASKAALINETRMLAAALAHADINVNCVCPGGLPTAMLRDVAEEYSKRVGNDPEELFNAMHADQVGRHLDLAEVARVVSFLLSDDAFAIRGQAINVDAGGSPH